MRAGRHPREIARVCATLTARWSAPSPTSTSVGNEEMPDKVRWIRSYVVAEDDGTLGTVCLYEATGPEAIREHADRVGMPADEIVEVGDTVVVRADPQAA